MNAPAKVGLSCLLAAACLGPMACNSRRDFHAKNPDIRIAKSIVDYIFRWLGNQFLPGYREANKSLKAADAHNGDNGEHADAETERLSAAAGNESDASQGPAKTSAQNSSNAASAGATSALHRSKNSGNGKGTVVQSPSLVESYLPPTGVETTLGLSARSEQFAAFQTDAPICDNCGAITVRNG
ncbi:MAG: hypothetical protein ACWGMZ_07925, partial [Thermoguttaceae bacterium]